MGEPGQTGNDSADALAKEPPGVAVGENLNTALMTQGLALGKSAFVVLDHLYLLCVNQQL